MTSAPLRWEIFCTVVDNFGDIGVCWRLARQLVVEQGQRVRLWVDDLASFRRINPGIDAGRDRQFSRGVEVRRWPQEFPVVDPADIGEVVVEAFACQLPPPFVAAMARRSPQPLWINLEYLSAEEWVVGCHGLASPDPRLPLIKYFFFPGFTVGTGGLLRERGLDERRRSFQGDRAAVDAFWRDLALPSAADEELRISLFAYGNRALGELVEAWASAGRPMRCLVPEGRCAHEVARLWGEAAACPGDSFSRGALRVDILPFLDQDRYDLLLWACDINFVRGEDSFVRAQWAGRPFVWQIYRQEEEVHMMKLEAFLRRYCAGVPEESASALRTFWTAWNREEGAAAAWPGFLQHHDSLTRYTGIWEELLWKPCDLATNLRLFAKKHL